MNNLKEKYIKTIRQSLMTSLGKTNIWAVPQVTKVVLNMGIGKFKGDKPYRDSAISDLSSIAGQKPSVRMSKKAISSFKLRQGEEVGVAVTLRSDKMWDFLENLILISLPRIRDFRGLSPKSFDGSGNYSIGIKEHTIFPTIDTSKIEKIKGMEISICTTAKNDKEAFSLLKSLGVPFAK